MSVFLFADPTFIGGACRYLALYVHGGEETPEIKLVSRPLLNGFVSYGLDKHWVFRVNAYNLLDEVYAVGLQHAYELDPSSPTTFSFEAEYRF